MKINLKSINMKQMRLVLVLFVVMTSYCHVFGNNIQVNNVALADQDVSAGANNPANFKRIRFDVSWDNSWRTSTFESNYDGAWVFAKWRKNDQQTWNHATLNYVNGTAAGDGHNQPAGSTVVGVSDGKGIFIHRDANGFGSVNYQNVRIRWNYGADGLADYDSVEICVFAIEMVYIPQGTFSVGTTGTETGSFTQGPWASGATIKFDITSEAAITIGNGAGQLWGTSSAGNSTIGGAGTLAANFPKGYKAFWTMKYEISQQQYVDFLNKLTRNQQIYRVGTNINTTGAIAQIFVMSNNANPVYRNGIRIESPIADLVSPLEFYCDLNNDGVFNDVADGMFIACNYLCWGDLIAYADWTGLRPMTELEYEKVCRGTLVPVIDEYAWGNTNVTQGQTILNNGRTNEIINTVNANGVYNNHASVQGPVRVGNFARVATNRQMSGGSYYGVMDLSGNTSEMCISVGNTTARANFTGLHGDGVLNVNGYADVTGWTSYLGTGGVAYRGGNWYYANTYMRVADRTLGTYVYGTRESVNSGGRVVRTAP